MRIAGGHAEQEVGKIQPGLRAIEGEAAVEDDVGVSVDLVGVEFTARFETMLAHDARECVTDLVDVFCLNDSGGVHAQREVVEGNVFNPLSRGLQRDNTAKSLIGERRSHTALRLAHGVIVAHITQVELVQCRLAEGDGVAEAGQLGKAVAGCVEAGNACSARACREGIVQRVAVEKVVAGQCTFAVGPVQPQRAFVVLQSLSFGSRGKERRSSVRLRN